MSLRGSGSYTGDLHRQISRILFSINLAASCQQGALLFCLFLPVRPALGWNITMFTSLRQKLQMPFHCLSRFCGKVSPRRRRVCWKNDGGGAVRTLVDILGPAAGRRSWCRWRWSGKRHICCCFRWSLPSRKSSKTFKEERIRLVNHSVQNLRVLYITSKHGICHPRNNPW